VTRTDRSVDVLVVGGGPSGLAVGAALAAGGAGSVEVLDRETEAGGIPRHSHHTGYGMRDLHRVMTGPAYARRRIELAERAGAIVRPGVSVTGWAGPLAVETTSPAGLERLSARAVVLATGARERARPARWVAGDRPAGVFTTGELQQTVYLHDLPVGRRAVVVGTEHVSYSALVTLAHAGVEVVALVTDQPRPQTYRGFQLGARLRWRTPVVTEATVTGLVGHGRLTAVALRRSDGATRLVACDTVVFTGDWIPDHELARSLGASLDAGTRGPAVDGLLRTSVAGVFGVGNLVHPVETADVAALRASRTAAAVLGRLRAEDDAVPSPVALVAQDPVAWVWPNLWRPDVGSAAVGPLTVWCRTFVERPTLRVVQDGRTLVQRSWRHTLVPNRPHAVAVGWELEVDPEGGDVVVSVT
jgi:thioredoxin reductase